MRISLVIIFVVMSSCSRKADQVPASDESTRLDAIVGTWRSNSVKYKRSNSVNYTRREKYIVITFTGDGRIVDYSVMIFDPLSGKTSGTSPSEGTYRISEDEIHWVIDGRKARIPYSIEGATMRATFGQEDFTFKKQAEQAEPLKP